MQKFTEKLSFLYLYFCIHWPIGAYAYVLSFFDIHWRQYLACQAKFEILKPKTISEIFSLLDYQNKFLTNKNNKYIIFF